MLLIARVWQNSISLMACHVRAYWWDWLCRFHDRECCRAVAWAHCCCARRTCTTHTHEMLFIERATAYFRSKTAFRVCLCSVCVCVCFRVHELNLYIHLCVFALADCFLCANCVKCKFLLLLQLSFVRGFFAIASRKDSARFSEFMF